MNDEEKIEKLIKRKPSIKAYKLIESEEEYEKELTWFKKAIKINMKDVMLNPPKAYNDFMDVIERAEGIGLFDKEYCDAMRKKLIDGIHDMNLKNKVKEYLKKKGLLK